MFELRALRGVAFRKKEGGRGGGGRMEEEEGSVGLLWYLSSSAVSHTELFIELH